MTVECGSFVRQIPTAQSGPGQLAKGQPHGNQDARSDCSGHSEVRERNSASGTLLTDTCLDRQLPVLTDWSWRSTGSPGRGTRSRRAKQSVTNRDRGKAGCVARGGIARRVGRSGRARGAPSAGLMWASRNRQRYAKRLRVRRATNLAPDGFHNRRLWHTPWVAGAFRPI
jgi:hypothetical protein